MALPPNMPTSFVPHTTGSGPERAHSNLSGALNIFAYGLAGLAVLLAIGIFAYGQFLNSRKEAKAAELATAQSAIDPATVENFVRLRNRLSYSTSLLDDHLAFSEFFNGLEVMLPQTVRFTSLHLSTEDNGALLEGVGVAKSFNALAATSNAFASDGRVRDAIFSNISVNKDSTVSFSLTANLTKKILEFSPSSQGAPIIESETITP